MPPFSLDHLDETTFEEFCFDLLGELGFVNRNWRKGTGYPSSPSDSGRDIECDCVVKDPLGKVRLERWFVEAKHSRKGVPPEKLQGILAWASAERPHHVLIIASNFLSNPAKDFLESYKRKNNPPFRIEYWERTNLEDATAGKSRLLRKYDISGQFPFLSIMHPAHLVYLKRTTFNSLDYFFTVLDVLDPQKREEVLSWGYHAIINPRRRPAVTGNEKLGDLYIDEISYEAFRDKCYEKAKAFDQFLLVYALVNFILQSQLSVGDLTAIDELVERHNSTIAYFQNLIREIEADDEDKPNLRLFLEIERDIDVKRGYSIPEEDRRERFESTVKKFIESRDAAPERTRRNYALYEYFCENVVAELLKQTIDLI
jgi:hypothetical protein